MGKLGRSVPLELRVQQKGIITGASLLLVWTLIGTLGFRVIEGWSLIDSFFMTIITISTVGYGEINPLSSAGRLFASGLIITGITIAVYTFANIGQLILEGELQGVIGKKKMRKELASLKDHYIVCGFGRIGKPVAEGLRESGQQVCVVDGDSGLEEQIREAGFLYQIGDATDDSLLLTAGIQNAKMVLALLASDADNLYLTMTVKELNPKVTVIARASETRVAPKLRRGGADKVISPYQTASARVLDTAIMPAAVEILELMTNRQHLQLSIRETRVSEASAFADRALANSGIRSQFNAIVVAIKKADGTMVFNPDASQVVSSGDTLVVIGKDEDLDRLAHA